MMQSCYYLTCPIVNFLQLWMKKKVSCLKIRKLTTIQGSLVCDAKTVSKNNFFKMKILQCFLHGNE
jgi:hypothetical protein